MDATTAWTQTNEIVTGLIGGLTPDHREMSTPCTKWTVHELIEHMCEGGHMIAGALQGQAPPAEAPDYLSEGPANGWAGTAAALTAAATPEALTALHQMPFGEVPGEMALSLIASDELVHGWDLAQATDQDFDVDPELTAFALEFWQGLVPADGRDGDRFADVVAVSDGASPLDQLIAYTGRRP